MAEDKKPKIDLKSRLKNMGGAAGAATSAGRAIGTPTPGPAIPVPPGIPTPFTKSTPPPPIDPNNPLAAVAVPFKPTAPPAAAAPQPQRIEVDEGAVQHAVASSRKKMLVVAIALAAVFAVIGYMTGGASEKSAAASQGKSDAQALAKDVAKAKDQLRQLASTIDDGQKSLNDKKWPADLQTKLAAIKVDFNGSNLFGRRFTGIDKDTVTLLLSFITDVQSVNDKKEAVQRALSSPRYKDPISADFALAAGTTLAPWVMVVDKNTGSQGAFVAALEKPLTLPKEAQATEVTYVDPRTKESKKTPRYTGGPLEKLDKEAAILVVPQSMDKAAEKLCGSGGNAGMLKQLLSMMSGVTGQIRGQQGSDLEEPKPGLIDTAEKLGQGLTK